MTALAIPTRGALATAPGSPEFERTACWMAREFSEATAKIRDSILIMGDQCERIRRAFEIEGEYCHSFDVGIEYHCRSQFRSHFTQDREKSVGDLIKHMERDAWANLANHLGIKNIMSVAKRTEFEKQLESGELPPINEETVVGILMGLAGQAKDFAKEAAIEVFELLRPRSYTGGQHRLKTNNPHRISKRVILTYHVDQGYGGKYRVSYHHEKHLIALDGVFHLLDGKGVMRDHRGPLVNAINDHTKVSGPGETEYFRFKCFKNGNLHLEFKRLDLVKELNYLAAGERVLGADLD